MAVRPFLVRMIGPSVFAVSVIFHAPAFAQADGKSAQIVVDAETNEILYENNAQAPRRPASITKVMTLYLLFDALKNGSISWDDRITFSRNAAGQPPTKLFVGAGNSIPVQTAVEALVLRSANDVATAVAERLGGSESNFAQMMTRKARELGMSSTTFRNASGLPNATQRTTAEDLARLAIAIHRDFPDQYHWFSAEEMYWNGQVITGHNHLMKRVAGMDGLKTGYTAASGFNLAATTQRNGRRVITVVLGGANRFQRDDLVEALTESAYRELGITTTQFAYNTTAYEVNFRDARDAADAAALVMDLPPRPVTTSGLTTVAMARSGRRLGFERGAPTFQVADMTRPPAARVIQGRGTQIAQRDDNEGGATDEGEDEVARPVTRPSPVPTPTPVPFRVAVASSPPPVPVRVMPTPVPVPVPVPSRIYSVPVPAQPTPVPVPLRQMAQTETATASKPPEPTYPAQIYNVPAPAPSSSDAAPPRQVAELVTPPVPASATTATQAAPQPLRGPVDAAVSPSAPTTNTEASPPQVAPTQMAEVVSPNPSPARTETAPAPEVPATQVAEVAPAPSNSEAAPTASAPTTQMAELAAQDAASLATPPATRPAEGELNGSINLNDPAAPPSKAPATGTPAAPVPQTTEAAPTQMAELNNEAVAQAQQRQAEANAREQARIAEAQQAENTRREAARVQAAAAARVVAERQANERRAARELAEVRAKAAREKEARDLAFAERQAAQERAVAAREEQQRQAEATRARNARGNAVVQVGAFKDKKDANAAISRFSRFFPTFAQGEVTTVSRSDGVWYRARFAGIGAGAAREACQLVLGRGGVCAIVGD